MYVNDEVLEILEWKSLPGLQKTKHQQKSLGALLSKVGTQDTKILKSVFQGGKVKLRDNF